MSVYSTRDAYNLYTYHLAIRNHFTQPSYDFFKYNGKVSASPTSFETRKDKFFYYKLSKRKEAKDLILSNILVKPKLWIGDICDSEKANDTLNDWQKKQQSLSYHFKNELGNLDDDFDQNILVKDGQHPPLIKLYNRKVISLETLVITIDLAKCLSYWDKTITDTVIYPDINIMCRKYRPFLNYERDRMRKILVDKFK